MSPYPVFQDTARISLTAGSAGGSFALQVDQLLPSLAINSSVERIVVFEKITLEIMPNEFTDQLLIQMRADTGQAASEPFKLASSINPTKFVLDYRKLARVIPSILYPVRVNNFDVARVQAYTDADTFQAYGRITSRVRILPQRSLLNTIPLFTLEESTPRDVPENTSQKPSSPLAGESFVPPANADCPSARPDITGPNDA